MFNLIRKSRDPMLEWLYNLERRMGRVFNEPVSEFESVGEATTAAWLPFVDITEDPEFVRIARNDLGEQTFASPAISNGQMFLRGERHLFCVGRLQ